MVGGYAPQVAFTAYVPGVQSVVPPVTKSNSNPPVVAFTRAFSTTATFPTGLTTLMKAAVFAPGAGVTDPVTFTCWLGRYDCLSVVTVIVYVVAATA